MPNYNTAVVTVKSWTITAVFQSDPIFEVGPKCRSVAAELILPANCISVISCPPQYTTFMYYENPIKKILGKQSTRCYMVLKFNTQSFLSMRKN